MRFEELAYFDRLPVTVPCPAPVTVVSGLSRPERLDWIERVLGALHGTRPGDSVRLVMIDGSGRPLRLERDDQGAATVTDIATGDEVPYAAAHLSLDGRFDWFATIGLDPRAARSLMVVDAEEFKQDDGFDVHAVESELAEARQVLTRVEAELQAALDRSRDTDDLRRRVAALDDRIDRVEEEHARRRHGQAVAAVRRLEAELAGVLAGAVPPERVEAAAVLAAVRTAAQWWMDAAALEDARRLFGDRDRLDRESLRRALARPTEVPARLEELHAELCEAGLRRADLIARLDDSAASELPTPSAPWVLHFARHRDPELWARAERVRASAARVAELSLGLGADGRHGDLVAELEAAHDAVEQAERQLELAKVPSLAMAAKRRLVKAEEDEQAVLGRLGFVSWLSFQMRRVDVFLTQDAQEALRRAETEVQGARAAWAELAGDVEAEEALARRAEIEEYARALDAAEQTTAATEALRRRLAEDVEPAYARARAALLDACEPFGVEVSPTSLEQVVEDVAGRVAEARLARLQHSLEQAEAEHRAREEQLEAHLAAAGLPARSPDDLATRVDMATARASEAGQLLAGPVVRRTVEEITADLDRARSVLAARSHPGWDDDPLITDTPLPDPEDLVAERDGLLAELRRHQRDDRPDADQLADRRAALERRVALLEASARAGYRLLGVSEAEMVLLARVARARRVDREGEPVPLLIDDALAGFARQDKWPLLDLLVRLGQAVQVVYLTDDSDTVAWAAARAGTGDVGFVPAGTATVVADVA